MGMTAHRTPARVRSLLRSMRPVIVSSQGPPACPSSELALFLARGVSAQPPFMRFKGENVVESRAHT